MEDDYAETVSGNFTFPVSSDNITINVGYECSGDQDAEGYIDYFGLNVRRNLIFEGSQMQFRDIASVGAGNTANFNISNASGDLAVWDITNVCLPKKMSTTLSGTTLSFSASADSLRQYIIFNPNANFPGPITDGDDVGSIVNQNIHGSAIPDMIIVTPPDTGIIRQAQILADFRTSNDGLKVFLTSTDKIYNEFSSGKRDISAIRDMAKMFYDKSTVENNMPKYLLLFGDGTYDNKSTNPGNNNLVPTYESANSLTTALSYVTDDFYGWLDDTAGDNSNLLDIGVGRLPIKNADEAEAVVNKIINYSKPSAMGDWRNILCFIGCDGDNNLHVGQADYLANNVGSNDSGFIIQKIYIDAYPYITTSVGQTCPDVNNAVNNRINDGVLIVNYTGHGNEEKLTHLGLLNVESITTWKNFNKLPLFITATCEYSRFDDLNVITPGEQFEERTSAGEDVLLNPYGGGVALYSTSRQVDAYGNFELNQAIYDSLFKKDNYGNYLRLGDVMRLAKNSLGSSLNKLNFTLLGDPATILNYPKGRGIVTDSISDLAINSKTDTLKALGLARVTGHIEDKNGAFKNGTLYTTVFDKEEQLTTIGNGDNTPFSYSARNSVIFKGVSNIINGKFALEFPIPKDINYRLGKGKLVYYADDSISDIAGFSNNLIVGSIENNLNNDTIGPKISLFMNDTNFVSGGITNNNPILLARFYDENGINMTGAGVGHDITAVLDDDVSNLVLLNDYYQSEINDFTRGSALYPFYNLNSGEHNIKVVAWDIYNNSSEATITFNVIDNNNLVIENVINFPNPFSSYTYFQFEHNSPDEALDVEIRIFSMSGQLIYILNAKNILSGFRTMPLQWNGTDSNGRQVNQGIYIYRISISTKTGKHAENYGKLVIIRSK